MAIALPGMKWTDGQSDAEALHQLGRIVLAVIDEEITAWAAEQYRKLRDELLSNNEYADVIPAFLRTYRSLPALSTYLGNLQLAPDTSVRTFVQEAFNRLDERAEALEQADPAGQLATDFLNDRPGSDSLNVAPGRPEKPFYDQSAAPVYSSTEWTGLPTPRSRVAAVKALFPAALQSLDAMITPEFSHNYGPPLDIDEDGLEAIRDLHTKLGEILALAQRNDLNNIQLTGIVAQLADYVTRARHAVRNNPLKYAVIGSIAAVGGFIWGVQFAAGVALTATFEANDK